MAHARGNSNRERGGRIHATNRPTDDAAPIVAPIGGLSEADWAAIQNMQQRLVYVHLRNLLISPICMTTTHIQIRVLSIHRLQY